MNQRIAKMKPASMSSFDDPVIRASTLIKFLEGAQLALEARGEEDSALRFECFKDYLRLDYKSGSSLTFSRTAIGM
jgi:hypothetical protein